MSKVLVLVLVLASLVHVLVLVLVGLVLVLVLASLVLVLVLVGLVLVIACPVLVNITDFKTSWNLVSKTAQHAYTPHYSVWILLARNRAQRLS